MYILFKQKDSLQNGKKCLCKLCDWSRDGLPKYPNDLHSSTLKKPHEQPNEKTGRPKQMYLWRRHTDGQQERGKMLDIANY